MPSLCGDTKNYGYVCFPPLNYEACVVVLDEIKRYVVTDPDDFFRFYLIL